MMNNFQRNLNGLHVMLSASLPKALEKTRRAQDLYDFMVVLIGGILSSYGTLVFGGHPTITPLIHRVATSAGTSTQPQIKLFQLRRFLKQTPEEIKDERVFDDVKWFGAEQSDAETLNSDLGKMRNAMVKSSQAAIFIGGQTEGFIGHKPGIVDEYERFTKEHPKGPAYLLGTLGGASLELIKRHEALRRPEPNSLNESELRILHHSDNVDLVSSIVLADLQRMVDRKYPW